MCERDDIEPPRKKLFCDQFECLNFKFVNIMLILPKFEVYIKNVKISINFIIFIPHMCAEHISFIILRLRVKIFQNFFFNK